MNKHLSYKMQLASVIEWKTYNFSNRGTHREQAFELDGTKVESTKKENGHQNTVLAVIDLRVASVDDLFRRFELVTIVLRVDNLTIFSTEICI